MGYGLSEDVCHKKLQGEIVYRKRNIRRQSFQLMAELKRLKTTHKTTFHDAEMITKPTNKVKFFL